MPAHPKVPDPTAGKLEEFAFDLRHLGEGKKSIPYIARQEGVSPAALYAALSGTRLPEARTIGALIRWWAGDPAAETPEPRTASEEEYLWWWWARLPPANPAWIQVEKWQLRYDRLRRDIQAQREGKPVAQPVQIPPPAEQQLFINALQSLIEATGLGDSRWLLFENGRIRRRVESYLDGTQIPGELQLFPIVRTCLKHVEADEGKITTSWQRLEHLADDARSARRRDRRIARIKHGPTARAERKRRA